MQLWYPRLLDHNRCSHNEGCIAWWDIGLWLQGAIRGYISLVGLVSASASATVSWGRPSQCFNWESWL